MGVKPKKKKFKTQRNLPKAKNFHESDVEVGEKKRKRKKTFSLGVWKESEDLAGLRRVRPVPESRDRRPKTTKV